MHAPALTIYSRAGHPPGRPTPMATPEPEYLLSSPGNHACLADFPAHNPLVSIDAFQYR